ncbi:hypothetical protein R1T08_24300 [Streptomyces sp. SBC-4]|nr:hypothetical protein [Streptomyces sp. SBC-4]MDV5147212.1 hypothetical protein [Streptomyces sp. SBC-4]
MNIIADASDTGKPSVGQQAGTVLATPVARFEQATLPPARR